MNSVFLLKGPSVTTWCGRQTLDICAFILPSCAIAGVYNQLGTILVHLARMVLEMTMNIALQEATTRQSEHDSNWPRLLRSFNLQESTRV